MFRSMRSKILAAVIAVTVATTLLVTIVFYWKSSKMIEDNYGGNMYARAKQMGDALDESLAEIYYLTVQASCDTLILEGAREYIEAGDEGTLEEIAQVLRDYAKRYRDIGSIYLVLPGEKVIVTSEDYPVYTKTVEEASFAKIRAMSTETLMPSVIKDPVRNSADILSFVSPVKEDNGNTIGYIMNNMDERLLYYKYLDTMDDGRLSKAVILDKYDRIICSKDQNVVGRKYVNENFEGEYKDGVQNSAGDSVIGVTYRAPFSEFSFFLEAKKSEVLGDLREIRYFLLLILILFSAAALVPAYFITKAMYRPLRNLTEAMEEVSGGDLERRVEITTKDEIGTLSKDFNRMLEHVEELIERLVKEEMLKKDAELEALQYQITPHFMYNTLNSIKYAALLKGEKEIGGLVEDFVELLQASINKKGTFVTVAEELHFLENYVSLQSARYEGRFEVVYDVEETAKGCFLPRLMLQPLVENAILHGIDMKNADSRIIVGAFIENDTLHLSVTDNGRGMTEEQIEVLLAGKEKKTSGLSGIGVSNVKERLSLYYGEKGGIRYESSQNGTKACIYMPAYKEQDKYAL